MNRFEIIANGFPLDIYEEVRISLNYQITDILDISKRKTSFSKTIQIPGTPRNNKFFKQSFDVNIDNINFNPSRRISAVVKVGDNDVMKGNIQLLNIEIVNKEIVYNIQISGKLKDIISEFGDHTLRDIDLSEFNHIRNQDNIKHSWRYRNYQHGSFIDFGSPGKGYVYPYIVNGNSTDIWDKVYIYDLFPAPYVKTVIDKAFYFAGFTYTSKFFESEYFKKLILPYSGDKLKMTKEQIIERSVKVGVNESVTHQSCTPLMEWDDDWYKNVNSNYTLGGLSRESGTVNDIDGELTFSDDLNQFTSDIFECAKAGSYDIAFNALLVPGYFQDFEASFNADSLGSEVEHIHRLQVFKVGGGVQTIDTTLVPLGLQMTDDIFTLPSGVTVYDNEAEQELALGASNVYLEPGDKVVVRMAFRRNGVGFFWNASNPEGRDVLVNLNYKKNTGNNFTKFTVIPSSNESLGNEEIDMNQILPDKTKMKDFFLDIVKMFNLVIQDNPDKDNDLIIEPYDDFFGSKQKILKWDDKLENNESVKITPMSELDARTYLYKYKDDSDLYNKEYTEETDKTYGELKIDVLNDFSNNINKTELKFSPTPCADAMTQYRVCPRFVQKDDESFKSTKVNQRILFYGGPLNAVSWQMKDSPTSSVISNLEEYPYCGMWDHPLNPKYDLGFGRTDKIYWNTSVSPNSNLFEQFHKSTLRNITDINSRLLEAEFKLTPKDIAQFDFRDVVFLMGSYWRVNVIKDYSPVGVDNLTKVILFKVIDINVLSPFSVDVPTSNVSCPVDLQAVSNALTRRPYYKSASGQIITEDCCNSIGGFYENGICFIGKFNDNGGSTGGAGTLGDAPQGIGSLAGPSQNAGVSVLNSGNSTVPVSETLGPQVFKKDKNSHNTNGVKVMGSGNFVPEGAGIKLMIGNNNSVKRGVENTVVIGDNIDADESNAIYLGNIKITENGIIVPQGISIIDGGEDEVFNFDRTNFIDVVDGTLDSVRNPGGDSKARPIIDGSDEF